MQVRLKDWLGFWLSLYQRFVENRGAGNAAALTYTTLFAVVPMMTVTFAMLSAIPAFKGVGEDIQGFIFHNFVPSTGEAVQGYLREFTTQARQLTWFGVGLLAVTAFLMLVAIEKTFNVIWRVRQPRRGMSSFLLYWAILSLGPLLLGAGFAVSTYIASLSLISGPDAVVGAKTLLGFAPLLSSIAAFTLLYAAVPNTRVPLRHALLGGLFSAVLFEVAKALFGLYVSLFPGYHLIYGAFATVPLFLLWIYLSWLIVLLGAELVYGLSQPRHWRREPIARGLILLVVLRLLLKRQQQGEALHYGDMQRAGWRLPEDEWSQVMDFLEREHLACKASRGGWVLCRDLHQVSLHQLLECSPWPLPSLSQLPAQLDEPWYPALREGLEHLQAEREERFGVSLAQWLPGKG
ncbi:YihY family inner membrane protein [Pseudomonas wenzhouensis]|uniref:YihY family inner membrane protein n=1 Tax=Pseudomonas wenzhouensis TaxID=2906062 RepID=UPI001E2FC14C|nr:YihY family inner membrane protein [Pseudomonas wenzhouensis]UFQ99036.1 YihY family inner membrane protein [Pseudomonas wenzhouensis]